MEFNIPEEAKKNFNSKLFELLKLLEFKEFEKENSKFEEENYNVQTIEGKDIIGFQIASVTDIENNEISRAIITEHNGYLGFFELNYKEYENICLGIQKLNAFKSHVSLELIQKSVFEWIIKKYYGNLNVEAIEYIVNESQKEIVEYEILIPISDLIIESEFTIGKVKFISLKKEQIDFWENEVAIIRASNSEEMTGDIKDYYEGIRKSYIGKTMGCVVVQAEFSFSIELAKDEINKLLSALRIFSTSNLTLNSVSRCTIEGDGYEKLIRIFALENNTLTRDQAKMKKDFLTNWRVSNYDFNLYWNLGLKNLHILLLKDFHNNFEKKLLDAILIYSKNALMPNVNDKIIYILTSLESILLANNNEPIQQNLSERIAILIGKDIVNKKEIIKNIKFIYGIRSKFIHHGLLGLNVEEKKNIKQFLLNIGEFYNYLINSLVVFKTKDELINFVEDKKLS